MVLLLALVVVGTASTGTSEAEARDVDAITVQGESPRRTNIAVDVVAFDLSRMAADQLGAYTKAAALGIADRSCRPLIRLPSITSISPGFQEVVLQNGAAAYADVWSIHGYGEGTLEPPPVPAVQNEVRRLHGVESRTEMWMTEYGVFLEPAPGDDLTPAQQVDQARYLVRASVEQRAAGTDRQFWFAGPPVCGSRWACFGLLSRDFQPWPSYSAYAAMASILGEASFVGKARGLPRSVSGFVFRDGARAITVVWADSPTEIDVAVPGRSAELYDIMGAPTDVRVRGGTVSLTASLDPVYIVSDGGRRLRGRRRADDHPRSRPFSTAQHVVVSQRFGVEAKPANSHEGHPLDAKTRMWVDVYNFNDAAQRVRVVGRAWGGWSVSAPRTVTVPAKSRISVPFAGSAGGEVQPQQDYPLVFDATLMGNSTSRRRIPPSVSRIRLASGPAGEPVPLAPSIEELSPADGASVTGPQVDLSATIVDALSGVDLTRIAVEVDGRRVCSRLDPRTGRLTASLRLRPGRHELWVRAYNNAHAPAQATMNMRVLP